MMKQSLFIFIVYITGCTTFDRHPDSGYSQRASKSTVSGWKKVEPKIENKSMLKEEPINDVALKLKQLENSLSTRKEMEQYSKNLPWFKSDTEKVQFLLNPTYEARQRWLSENDFFGRSQRIKATLQELADTQDIALGMPDELVKKAWGEPQNIDVSGNPYFRNHRWRYSKYVPSNDGYKQERKTVYFEGGKVVGWEIE